MHMTLRGSPPPEVLEAIFQAGFQTGPAPEVVLHWLEGEALPETGTATLALLPDADRIAEILSAGALGVIVASTPRATTLQLSTWRKRQAAVIKARQERRMLEGRLRVVKKLQDELLATASQPIIAANHTGRVVLFNAAAVSMLGYSTDYATTQLHVSDIYANPTDARRVLAEIRCSPDGYLRDYAVRLRARSGEQLPIYLSATAVLGHTGSPGYTIGILQDRRTELALRGRLEKASQQVLRSEQRASGASATRIAIHELNQPLTALMGTVELLDLRSDLPTDVHGRLERMYEQLDRMAEIVRGLGGDIPNPEPTP